MSSDSFLKDPLDMSVGFRLAPAFDFLRFEDTCSSILESLSSFNGRLSVVSSLIFSSYFDALYSFRRFLSVDFSSFFVPLLHSVFFSSVSEPDSSSDVCSSASEEDNALFP